MIFVKNDLMKLCVLVGKQLEKLIKKEIILTKDNGVA